MSDERRVRLWGLVVDQASGAAVTIEHVGAVAMAAAMVDATAISVILAASPRETIYCSNQTAVDIEELTLTVGEGPGVDALSDGPALAGDLRDTQSQTRWPVFAPAAVDGGVLAAFALPLRVGGIHLGVMGLYRSQPGDLGPEQLADALLLADTACALLLDVMQQGPSGPDGFGPERASSHHPEVHQATGMIIEQLGVTAAVALVRLRAYAYANDRRLGDVAADVVTRRLRFQPNIDGNE